MFEFGKNWQKFLNKHFTQNRLKEAEKSLQEFMSARSLSGKTFLDVGCGSGLFSLAAFSLGAAVESFDVDEDSVACAKLLREKYTKENLNNQKWTITHGSVLDKNFLGQVSPADIVYSWGVLHHTGHMWEAVSNAQSLVKPGGLLYIAIYNKKEGILGTRFWKAIKQFYNSSPMPVRYMLEFLYAVADFIYTSARGEWYGGKIKEYKNLRGMSYWTDVRDWLGGYPYEAATADEINKFIEKDKKFTLLNSKVINTLACNEFLFRKGF